MVWLYRFLSICPPMRKVYTPLVKVGFLAHSNTVCLHVKTFTPKQPALFSSSLLWTRPRNWSQISRIYGWSVWGGMQTYCFNYSKHTDIMASTRFCAFSSADGVVDVSESRFPSSLALHEQSEPKSNTLQIKSIQMNSLVLCLVLKWTVEPETCTMDGIPRSPLMSEAEVYFFFSLSFVLH